MYTYCQKGYKVVRTPWPVICLFSISFVVDVWPQNRNFTISNDRWSRRKDTIQERHSCLMANFWADTSYIISKYTTQCAKFVKFRICTVFANSLNIDIYRPNDFWIHVFIVRFICYQFNNRSNWNCFKRNYTIVWMERNDIPRNSLAVTIELFMRRTMEWYKQFPSAATLIETRWCILSVAFFRYSIATTSTTCLFSSNTWFGVNEIGVATGSTYKTTLIVQLVIKQPYLSNQLHSGRNLVVIHHTFRASLQVL